MNPRKGRMINGCYTKCKSMRREFNAEKKVCVLKAKY